MHECVDQLVFKANRDNLFKINSLKLWYVQVEQVHESAAFLFENIIDLEIKNDNYSMESLSNTADIVNVFQRLQLGGRKIESVNVEVECDEDLEAITQHQSGLGELLTPLAAFNLKSLLLTAKVERNGDLESELFSENWLDLVTLHLSGLSVRVIKPDTFVNLAQLRDLALEFNQLEDECLNVNSFNGLQSLRILSLRGNKLTKVPRLLFEKLWRLERLDLAENQLVSLEAGAFSPLTFLNDLLLSRNGIVSVEEDSFDGLVSLLLLDLAGNPVAQSIDKSIFKKHLTSIIHVQLT
jgi:hypothetical protein